MEQQSKAQGSPFGVLEFLHWDYPWSNFKYAKKDDVEKAVALMRELGVGFVRMDFLWEDIECRQGEFNFAKYDYLVEVLTKNNIAILGLLNYGTPWATESGQWNSPPKQDQWFVTYAVKVIERYKGSVKYWEVWNEPDSSIYWAPQDGLQRYCALLKQVYVAAKKVDPACKILNGGLANGLTSVHRLYDNGAGGSFDILNIHYFDAPLREGALKAVIAYPRLAYKVMSKNGDKDKKIWITEIGAPGVPEGETVNPWWLGENPDEDAQARWLGLVFGELLKEGSVEKIFWAYFRDCKGHWNNGVDYFGLIRWDFSKKPAFSSYQNCIEDWKKKKAH